MNRRHFLSQLGWVGLGVLLAFVFDETFLNRHADRRFTLYNIRRELQKSMALTEVETIIGRHDAPFIRKHIEGNKIFLSVGLGGRDYLYLSMDFTDGKLSKAYFGGEDNPWDVPKDVPANLE